MCCCALLHDRNQTRTRSRDFFGGGGKLTQLLRGKRSNNIKVIVCNLKHLQLIENNLISPMKSSVLECIQLFLFCCIFLFKEKRQKVVLSWSLLEIIEIFNIESSRDFGKTVIHCVVVSSLHSRLLQVILHFQRTGRNRELISWWY